MPASWQDLARQHLRHSQDGEKLRVCCPFHDDTNPSATLYESGVMVCHACKENFSPWKWAERVGIPEHLHPEKPKGKQGDRPNLGPPTAEYLYRDAEGEILYRVLRFDPPGAKKQFKMQRWDGKRFLWSLKDDAGVPIKRVPFHLDYLHRAKPWDPILWVEGEKDAVRAMNLGLDLLATTSPGGAGNFAHVDRPSLEFLRGRTIHLIPDNDQEGERYAADVARALLPLGVDVRIVRLPDLGQKGDLSDWLNTGHTPAELEALLEDAPPFTPANEPPPEDPTDYEDAREALLGSSTPRPNFPLEIFPGWLAEYARQVAVETQTMPAAAGFLALAALSTACQKKFRVHVFGKWVEPLNLYTCTAMESGDRKSAVFRHFQGPIHEYEAEQRKALEEEIQMRSYERHRIQKRIDEIKAAKANKEKDTDNEAMRDLIGQLQRLPEITRPIWFGDDATPEALAGLLATAGERLSLYSPEGGLFTMVGGRYSSKGQSNLDLYLKAYSEEWVRSHRQTRAAVELEKPLLTICVMVQPEVLTATAAREDFRRSGFLGRFLWTVPGSFVGRRKITPAVIADQAEQNYRTGIRALLRVPEPKKPTTIPLTEGAMRVFNLFREWVEEHLSGLHDATTGDLSAMAEWGQKLPGNTARVAGLLHLASLAPGWSMLEHASDAKDHLPPMPEKTMMRACQFAIRFLVPHAQHVFYDLLKIGERPERDAPPPVKTSVRVKVVDYLQRKTEENPSWTFTRQKLWQLQKHRFDSALSFRDLFEKLFEIGIIEQVESEEELRSGRGGRSFAPSFRFKKDEHLLGLLGGKIEASYTQDHDHSFFLIENGSTKANNHAVSPNGHGFSLTDYLSSLVNSPPSTPETLECPPLQRFSLGGGNKCSPLTPDQSPPNNQLGGPRGGESRPPNHESPRSGDPIQEIEGEDYVL